MLQLWTDIDRRKTDNERGAVRSRLIDWAPTQYRLYGQRFLQVKRPNQQYQSSEGESYKGKQPKNKENTKYTYAHTQKIAYN